MGNRDCLIRAVCAMGGVEGERRGELSRAIGYSRYFWVRRVTHALP